MRTFIFRNGNETEVVKARNIEEAWEALEIMIGDTTGWELSAEQG